MQARPASDHLRGRVSSLGTTRSAHQRYFTGIVRGASRLNARQYFLNGRTFRSTKRPPFPVAPPARLALLVTGEATRLSDTSWSQRRRSDSNEGETGERALPKKKDRFSALGTIRDTN